MEDPLPDDAVLTARCCSFDREFLATLSGALAGDAAHDFGEILVLESWRELDRIGLDLRYVSRVDLIGLAGLWRAADAQRQAGGCFEVQSLSPHLERRFRAFGLTGRIDMGRTGEIRTRLSHASFEL